MAASKTDVFSEEEIQQAAWAKALAHPARIAILKVLARRDTCICGEIVDELPLAQSTVSQHLKALKEAGFIQGDIDGPRTCYCLDMDVLSQCRSLLDGLFQHLEETAPTCC